MICTRLVSTTPRHVSAPTDLLSVAYTSDSDDVLNFYAWEHGHIPLPGIRARFQRNCIRVLNQEAADGIHDVVSVSSAFYPHLADNYWILSAGSSVGRGYGPVLVAREPMELEELRNRKIAVGGLTTTGHALARMYCPHAHYCELPYDRIADAILSGQVDAGVMIHEELLYYTQLGLCRVCDLGATWCQKHRLPLPVGLNVVHRRVGRDLARRIDNASRESLRWGLGHPEQAIGFAAKFGRGCTHSFVEMFSNHDTLRLPDDAIGALRYVFDEVAELGLAPRLPEYEVIHG